MSKVTVRYIKNGRVATMDKRYADVLIGLKRVELVIDQAKPSFGSSFKSTIVTKPVLEKEIITKEETQVKAEATKTVEVKPEISEVSTEATKLVEKEDKPVEVKPSPFSKMKNEKDDTLGDK